ncbi:MAG TPA: hypothetical protein PKO06_04240, partial [Candidatus Ozemobacteraceae bacterium]|nr:hypothetical protein [Candidatus Ozemobacteraceae bacterium]
LLDWAEAAGEATAAIQRVLWLGVGSHERPPDDVRRLLAEMPDVEPLIELWGELAKAGDLEGLTVMRWLAECGRLSSDADLAKGDQMKGKRGVLESNTNVEPE